MPNAYKLKELHEAQSRAGEQLKNHMQSLDPANITNEDREKADKLKETWHNAKELYKTAKEAREAEKVELEVENLVDKKQEDIRKQAVNKDNAFEIFLFTEKGDPRNFEARNYLQVADDQKGGAVVMPEQMVQTVLQEVDKEALIRQYASQFNVPNAVSLGAVKMNDKTNSFTWGTETSTPTKDDSIQFGKRNLFPHAITGEIQVTEDMLNQSTLPIASIIAQRIAYKVGDVQETAFMLGTGVNQPLGLFTASSDGISTARDIETANAIASSDMVYEDWVDLYRGVHRRYRGRGAFLCHEDRVTAAMKLKDGDGRPLWMVSMREGEPDTILGKPVIESDYAPNTESTGEYAAMYGDFSNYWIANGLNYGIRRHELDIRENKIGFITRLYVDGMPTLEEAFTRMKFK